MIVSARRIALAIGCLFGSFFLVFFIPETIAAIMGHHSPAERAGGLNTKDYVLLSGPLIMVVGTIAAFKLSYQKIAGALMLAAGTVGFVIMVRGAFQNAGRPSANLTAALLVYAPPMIAGILFIVSRDTRQPTK